MKLITIGISNLILITKMIVTRSYRVYKKKPTYKTLDSKASNTKLVKQGLKYAITVYGSCAAELSLMGVKVVALI